MTATMEADTAERVDQRWTLAVAAAGTLLVLISFTTPVATLASTAAGLAAGPGAQAWVLSSMSLGLAAGLLGSGAVADDYGRRRVFLAGAAVLLAGEVGCAVAGTPLVFVLARVAAGLGGAAVLACSLGLIGHAYPAGPARARATGWWGASVGAGIATGPLLAVGLDMASGWRAAHWAIAVLAAALAVAGRARLVESRSAAPRPVDVAGIALLGLGLASLLAGLVEGREGWGRPLVAALLAAGAALTAAFVLVERRRRAPMLDLALFRRPDFVAVTAAALATGLGVIAMMSFLPTLMLRGLHDSALVAAVVLLAWSGTSVLTALGARRLRVSPRAQLAVSLLGIAAGQATLYGLRPDSSVGRLLPGLLLAGVASGVLNAALGRQAVASVPAGRAAMGSGANNTARYVGSAVGVTVFAVIATRAGAGGLVAGWNDAALVTTGMSLLGALAVLACRPARLAA
jgi:MFS family permease